MWKFSDSSLNHIFWIRNVTNRASENGRGFMRKVSKIVHEWNGYRDIFSRPQVIENARPYLLLLTDISQKQSLGAPALDAWLKYIMGHLLGLTFYIKNFNKHEIFYYICHPNLQTNEKSKIWQNLTSWNQAEQKTFDPSELILKGNYKECTRPRST